MIKRFLTTEQVANILQVHPFTILKFLKEGKLKGIKLGRVYRIKESDVHEFLEERATLKIPKKSKSNDKEPKKDEKSDDSSFKVKKKDDNEDMEHYYVI